MSTIVLTVLITVIAVHLVNMLYLVLADEFGWPDDSFNWVATFTVAVPMFWLFVKPIRAIRRARRRRAKALEAKNGKDS